MYSDSLCRLLTFKPTFYNAFSGGKSYYIIYMDDYTRWCEIYFLVGKTADEIVSKSEQLELRWNDCMLPWVMTSFLCSNYRHSTTPLGSARCEGKLGVFHMPVPIIPRGCLIYPVPVFDIPTP